jgi:hypothetical protein
MSVTQSPPTLQQLLGSSVLRKVIASLALTNGLVRATGNAESVPLVRPLCSSIPSLSATSARGAEAGSEGPHCRYALSFVAASLQRSTQEAEACLVTTIGGGDVHGLTLADFERQGPMPRADVPWLYEVVCACEAAGGELSVDALPPGGLAR